MQSKKQQFLAGLHDGVPIIIGFIPIGIAFAIMARQSGFTVLQTTGMSITVFAGASQMMAAGMTAQGAGILAIIVTTFILNLRHIIMSTCVYQRMEHTHPLARLLTAFGVTDETFAVFTTTKKENCTVFFFAGLVIAAYSSWIFGTFIGAIASDLLPTIVSASLGIGLYAMFIGLLFPALPGNWRLCALVVLTAIVNTLLSLVIPSSWALIASTLLCAFIGVFFVDPDNDAKEGTAHEHN